ncbi:hypothetical protein IAD21_06049 [Abditibacteriota bacterium]|nr:hypothetical protein IAD21_06049 [Abditibacteriota bacterium]
MLTRLIEHLLIGALNRSVRRDETPREKALPPQLSPPDHAAIGHSLGEGAPQEIALSPEARRRHLYILGATGTGKTNLLLRLIESDIQQHRAFCVIDLRGDLVDRILLRLAAHAPAEAWRERLLLMDLRESDTVVGFNPLAGEGDVYNRALHLLSVIKIQSDSWGIQLEETLRNCLLALGESGWSLLEIEPLLTNASFRSQVMEGVSDTRVRSFFERFEALSAANQTAWTLAVLNKISPLLSIPALRLMFGQRQSFSFRTLMDNEPGMIVLVSLAVDRLHDAARLAGGLLVSSFQSAIMSRVDVPEKARVPFDLYIDEFECMANDRFEAIVAEGRRFGLGLTLSHQNISQLSTGLRNVLRNNVHTQVYFQTGALDAAELAREIGSDNPEDVKATLISQGVGEAFLVRRGQPSVRIKVHHAPDPPVKLDQVRALRRASAATYAKPRAEVERELAERERSSAGPGKKAIPLPAPIYEIHHSKTATYKPKAKGTKAKEKTEGSDE